MDGPTAASVYRSIQDVLVHVLAHGPPLWSILGSVREGDLAPLPRVRDAFGEEVDLAACARGGWLVLFFYPKAGSPGCSLQARRYAALREEFRRLGASVFGVSTDRAEVQCRFAERTGVGMIPDPEGALAQAYGVRRKLGRCSRDTVLIDREGRVAKIWRRVNPLRDADRVLSYLRTEAG